ncbi:MAG: signal recognition particle protein Srp19 [Desulfurococcus sp.]|nr:signal recognition particle protein Srp19 [Desulfurococcus sp.]
MSTRDYEGRRIIIYPHYIDARRSRRKGRKISLSKAVPSPSISEILKACEKLGLNPTHEDKSSPRSYDIRGRVVIDKKARKLELLHAIAREIKAMRSPR